MSTAAPKLVDIPTVFPKHEGRDVHKLRIAFSGGIELDLADKDNREWYEVLKLDREATVRISIDNGDDDSLYFDLAALVTESKETRKKEEDAPQTKRTVKVAVNRHAWEEPEEEGEGPEAE